MMMDDDDRQELCVRAGLRSSTTRRYVRMPLESPAGPLHTRIKRLLVMPVRIIR